MGKRRVVTSAKDLQMICTQQKVLGHTLPKIWPSSWAPRSRQDLGLVGKILSILPKSFGQELFAGLLIAFAINTSTDNAT